jgi:hypothetical protein
MRDGACGIQRPETYLTMVIGQLLCPDDSVEICLHQLLDDCVQRKLGRMTRATGQRAGRTIDLLELIYRRRLDDVKNADDL